MTLIVQYANGQKRRVAIKEETLEGTLKRASRWPHGMNINEGGRDAGGRRKTMAARVLRFTWDAIAESWLDGSPADYAAHDLLQ
ncbi:hypothetical protein NPIL_417801 [Nephila pilipes]|uniref:Uncharacterized protein n=1 Tax=Nephila pilipes TaxID=299642 RepID=A0A8X6N8N5_NEPPI|nr:hypothetical protein NPIL_417801 [Nephila pilipes]